MLSHAAAPQLWKTHVFNLVLACPIQSNRIPWLWKTPHWSAKNYSDSLRSHRLDLQPVWQKEDRFGTRIATESQLCDKEARADQFFVV